MKWNILWDRYANGSSDNDYFVLCDYHSGVNGGGHHCFLDNNAENLQNYPEALKVLLPNDFFAEFQKACEAYIRDDADVENICDEADDYFYANEQVIVDLLQSYADTLE